MLEKEIYQFILDELKEYHLSAYREQNHEEYASLNNEIINLRIKVDEILSELSKTEAEVIEQYIAKTSALADKDCSFLYVQGATDCAKLLKKIGII